MGLEAREEGGGNRRLKEGLCYRGEVSQSSSPS